MSKAMTVNPMRGAPPSIEFKAVGELEIDETYQRSADDRAAQILIGKIALDWDWRLCAPLTVSRRGSPPRFYVIDGQHRLKAAQMRGDIDFLPCIISSFETVAEEAGCFIAVNTRRRPVKPLETFKAQLAASDAGAVQVHAVITAAGLSVAAHSNPIAWKPGMIACIQGVRGAIFRHGEEVALAALEDLATAHPDQVLQYAGSLLGALYDIHSRPPVDRPRLVAALASRTQGEWYAAMTRRQAKFGELQASAMIYAIRDLYDAQAVAA